MSEFIKTRASSVKVNNFQEIVHESYKSKGKRKIGNDTQPELLDTKQISENEFNMKKARYEVIKFGISGLESGEKQKANVELAIKLGAKPPKKKGVNYKTLLAEQKQKKLKGESQQQFQQMGKNSMGKSTAKGKSFDRKRRKAAKSGLLDVYGKPTLKNTNNSSFKKKR